MIVDAYDSSLPSASTLVADVCIVGAGAAGISLALELSGQGLQVLLLEAGGIRSEDATQALYAGEVVDARLHPPPQRYRARRFGGSTTLWGGRCMPFDPIDFEPRDYVADSGWPIEFSALADYYPRANALCEAGAFAYSAQTAFAGGLPALIEGFSSRDFSSDALERFSRPTDFGAVYAKRLHAALDLRVVLHANVVGLCRSASADRLEALEIATLDGKRLRARARQFVLATGGLEVARLLLASAQGDDPGIGNRHDVVGRYYMCHLAGSIGTLALSQPAPTVDHGYHRDVAGVYCRRRLALRASAQRRLRIGNFIARLHHPRITDPRHRSGPLSLLYLARSLIPYEYARRLHGDDEDAGCGVTPHLRNLFCDLPATARLAWTLLVRRALAARKFPSIIVHPPGNRFSIDFHAEQQPNRFSRVLLGAGVDALGMPQLRIDWRHSPADVHTVRVALAALAHDLQASAVGRLHYDPAQVETEMLRYGAYGGHHLGTARMGLDPRRSVVNADCRVHDMANLYIAGGAVFPTSSQANPTLTVVALALRLADHLRNELRRTPLASADGASCVGRRVAASESAAAVSAS